MDAIDALDWGVYSHFDFVRQQDPRILPVVKIGYYISSYIGVGILLLVALLLFLVRGKLRSAVIALLSAAFAVGLIQTVRWLVPRHRPEKAAAFLGPDNMIGSYPSAAVFLFMLAMILIGFAFWGLTRSAWLRGLYVPVAAFLTVWVCMSQFLLALHFFTDVLGGTAGATLVGWLAYQFVERDPPLQKDLPTPLASSNAIQDLSHAQGIQKK